MLRKLFLITFCFTFMNSIVHADQVTIQADITILDECPDYSQWDTRALITELKKLKTDIWLYYAGQIPSVLMSAISLGGSGFIASKVIKKEWHPSALIGSLGCLSASPAFVALSLILENKKTLARYNINEINEQLALRTDAIIFE